MTRSLQAWQAARRAELAGADSWLGLVGLFWLEPGANAVGSGADCPVRLPDGPERLGELLWQDDALVWQPADGPAQPLQTDRAGAATVLAAGSAAFFVVEREGRLAARVRDRAWASRHPFAGLEYFPEDPAWVIDAAWQPIVPPLAMEVPNVSGELKRVEVAHKAVFAVAGQTVELLPMAADGREVFFVFRDRTSGRETYGAGRFLKARPAVDGRIRLDFNRAFNPPCAFTPFATCPLPPPENWLPCAVPAGEKKYAGEH